MRNFTAIVVALLMCLQCFTIYAVEPRETVISVDIYCAPYGNDNADGSIDAPLKTLDGARKKVASLRAKNPNVPINVNFRGGEYKLTSTTQFTSDDSGTKDAPVTYRAYGDEKPIFTGATKIPAESFKSLDANEQSRVPEEARKYVGVADLKKLGVHFMTRYEGFDAIGYEMQEYVDKVKNTSTTFLYNNKEQSIARWPNGLLNFAKTGKVTSNSVFQVDDDDRMGNWMTADNAVLFGWFNNGYSAARIAVKEFIPEASTVITTADIPRGVAEGKLWSVTNLLEELDVPGEFYVDTTTLKLYFYPPYTDKDAVMELVTNETVVIKMDDASNITFEGLAFHKTRNDVFEMRNCDSISILGCEFKNVSLMAVDTMWCTNTTVDGCDFISIGSTGVRYDERNDGHMPDKSVDYNSVRIDLTPDNNVVNNCYFYDIGVQSICYTGAVRLHGVGNTISRSSIHNGLASFIHHGGNDNSILNNELWNGLKFSHDMGMIYNGRQVTQRGNETAYNYIHDWDSSANPMNHYGFGIYDDDSLMGHNKHHNVVANGEAMFASSGQIGSHWTDNIFANTKQGVYIHDFGWSGRSNTFYRSTQSFVNVQIPQVYTLKSYEKYDNIRNLFFLDMVPTDMKYTGNLEYNTGTRVSVGKNIQLNGTYEESLNGETYLQYFNDPDNGDYTIRTDIEVPEELKELQKIQLDDIGIYKSETRKNTDYGLGEFKAYYPYQYTDDVDSSNVFLTWEESDNADRYILELSDTMDFENVIQTVKCSLNYAVLDDLEADKTTYYWRVKAVSDGLKNREERMCTNDVMVFRTGAPKAADKTLLEAQISETEDTLSRFVEGTEIGNVAYGTVAEGNALINQAKEYMASNKVTQRNVDEMVMMLQNFIADAMKLKNIFYSDIKNVFDNDAIWNVNDSGKITKSEDEIVFSSKDNLKMGVASSTADPIDYKTLKRFRIRTGVPSGSGSSIWQAIAFDSSECSGQRSLDVKGGVGFMLLLKDGSAELQIRDGVSGALVVAAENPFVCGEYADLEIGVVNDVDAQRYIVNVNDKNIFNYRCTDRKLTKDLYLSLYDAPYAGTSPQTDGFGIKPLDVLDPKIFMGSKVSFGNMDFAGVVGDSKISVSSGEKFSKEKVPDNYTIAGKVTYSPDLGEQGIVFRSSEAGMNGECYIVSFHKNKMMLKKKIGQTEQILSMCSIEGMPKSATISINAGYVLDGLNLNVIFDGASLIDYTDNRPIRNHGYLGIFSKSASEIKLEQ